MANMSEKARLLEAIAGTNRGLLATVADRSAIGEAIAQLEAQNPNPRPTETSDLLEGNWRLLYTTSQDLLNLGQFPLFTLGQIYQCIRIQSGQLYNIAEVSGLPYLEGLLSVTARFEALSDCRVSVNFERRILALQRLVDYQSPDDLVRQLEGGMSLAALSLDVDNGDEFNWLDTTYLDEDLRVGRGSRSSIFVLTKR